MRSLEEQEWRRQTSVIRLVLEELECVVIGLGNLDAIQAFDLAVHLEFNIFQLGKKSISLITPCMPESFSQVKCISNHVTSVVLVGTHLQTRHECGAYRHHHSVYDA